MPSFQHDPFMEVMRSWSQPNRQQSRHEVGGVVGAAALPDRAWQVRRDRFDQPGVGVAGDEADAGQSAGDQVGEEGVPGGLGLGGGDLQAEDLAVAVAVDAGGHQHDGVDHPAAFADLHRERVGGDERERAGVS